MSTQGTTPKPEHPQNLAAKPTQAHLVPSQRVPRLPWEGALGLPGSVARPGPCGGRNTLLTCLGLCTLSCSGHCTSTVPRGPIFIYGAGEDFILGPLSLSPLPNERVLRSEAVSGALRMEELGSRKGEISKRRDTHLGAAPLFPALPPLLPGLS